ncbi:MAG: hypothetical protein FWB73_09120 [Treponema sp.]|nr:hypothetical protein [Treponema sp.]
MLLFGHKTTSMFDLWSIEHFANGLGITAITVIIIGKLFKETENDPFLKKKISFILLFTLSLFWECVEHYIEAGILSGSAGDRVTHWFQGVEHWSNRLIGDTLMVMLGWYVFTKVKKLALPAKIFSLIWLIIHIFVFPDSMYLQRLLFS